MVILDLISEFVWLMLGGLLILSTQLNALKGAKCKIEEKDENFSNMNEKTSYFIRE